MNDSSKLPIDSTISAERITSAGSTASTDSISEAELLRRSLEQEIARAEERADRIAKQMREANDRVRRRIPVLLRCAISFLSGMSLGILYFLFFSSISAR